MGLDLSNDYNKAKTKISAYQTTVESKKDESREKKQKSKTSLDKKKSDVTKQLNELKSGTSDIKNQIKNEVKNQLEQLLDLFKQSLPKSGNKSLNTISRFFLEAAEVTKSRIGEILVEEIVSTIGCSEEQSYEDKLNQPIYIKVSQVDLFKRLKFSPDDKDVKFYYENTPTNPGIIPNSVNRVLYDRLQNLGQSYQTQLGSDYRGVSGQDLFDIEYVQFYPAIGPTNFGDFFKVTLKPQLNSRTTVSDFLRDYYGSIDILQFDVLTAEIMNALTGAFDFSSGISTDELREQKKFDLILKRIMGICTDPAKKIDVAGTAKLSDQDLIDDGFFEVSNQELRFIEESINNTINGVVQFEDCGDLKLPVNPQATRSIVEEVITENVGSKKIDRVEQAIGELANDPKWKELGLDINLKASLDTSLITQLPKIVFKTILSPKVMLGFLIMVKAITSQLSSQLDNLFDDLEKFMKTFRKFVVNFMQKVTAIFVEELFKIVKKQIKQLVEKILSDIVKEAKNKQLAMYSAIVYALLALGQALLDYRNCKSVIDDILKLLNLGISQLNLGLPLFALAGSSLLSGVSNTRAFANVIENLQSIGLPTGDAPDGGPNLMNMSMMSQIKGSNLETFTNGKVEVYIPPPVGFAGPFPITAKPSKGSGKFM
jgi:hypothetical protein